MLHLSRALVVLRAAAAAAVGLLTTPVRGRAHR